MIFFIMPLSVVLHELGHIWAFRRFGRKVKIRIEGFRLLVGQPADYANISKDELVGVYLAGIGAGLIVWFIPMMLFNNSEPLFIGFIGYMVACSKDVTNIWKINNELRSKKYWK